MKWPFTLKRAFTLFPRRFYSYYWYNNGSLHFTRWWQWGRRCFFIYTKTFVRPTFSTWEQIESRVKIDDKDALLIKHLIETLTNYNPYVNMKPNEIYDEKVRFVK